MKKISWEDIENITDELADKIKASGFKPDYIIGITAGGLIPLFYLSKKLSITDRILTVSAKSYVKDKKGDVRIIYLPKVDLKGKKILLVDEITGSGDTLKRVSGIMMDDYGVGELKTVTLVVNEDKEKYYPDFFSIKVSDEWVVFPWDKTEFPEYF